MRLSLILTLFHFSLPLGERCGAIAASDVTPAEAGIQVFAGVNHHRCLEARFRFLEAWLCGQDELRKSLGREKG
jgi:hypothetical protein